MRCKLRSLWARVRGIRWDGHCWGESFALDLTTNELAEVLECIDCGLLLGIFEDDLRPWQGYANGTAS